MGLSMLHRTKRASIKYGTRVIYRMNRQLKRCLSVCGVCVQHSSDNNHARHLKVCMYVCALRPPAAAIGGRGRASGGQCLRYSARRGDTGAGPVDLE